MYCKHGHVLKSNMDGIVRAFGLLQSSCSETWNCAAFIFWHSQLPGMWLWLRERMTTAIIRSSVLQALFFVFLPLELAGLGASWLMGLALGRLALLGLLVMIPLAAAAVFAYRRISHHRALMQVHMEHMRQRIGLGKVSYTSQ